MCALPGLRRAAGSAPAQRSAERMRPADKAAIREARAEDLEAVIRLHQADAVGGHGDVWNADTRPGYEAAFAQIAASPFSDAVRRRTCGQDRRNFPGHPDPDDHRRRAPACEGGERPGRCRAARHGYRRGIDGACGALGAPSVAPPLSSSAPTRRARTRTASTNASAIRPAMRGSRSACRLQRIKENSPATGARVWMSSGSSPEGASARSAAWRQPPRSAHPLSRRAGRAGSPRWRYAVRQPSSSETAPHRARCRSG